MAALARPIYLQKTPTKFLQTRVRTNRRLVKPVRVQAALPSPDSSIMHNSNSSRGFCP